MALSENAIITTGSMKERKAHGSSEFPCAGYERELLNRPGDVMAWHCHPEMEVMFIREGRAEIRLVSRKICLKQGDFILINANTLHFACSPDRGLLEIFVFSPLLVEGSVKSSIAVNYVEPLLHDRKFTGEKMSLSKAEIHIYEDAFQKLKNDVPGYELAVRNALSDVILHAYLQLKPDHSSSVYPDRDRERIAIMLDFIHQHYMENICLLDIAETAHIGKREALRCFHRTIGEAPMQYLMKYRLMKSADELIRDPDLSISAVAIQCGFTSPSYFTKKFREFYHFTPKEFARINHRN